MKSIVNIKRISRDTQNDPFLVREKMFVTVFLFLICLVLARFIHESWFISILQLDQAHFQTGFPVYYLFESSSMPLHAPESYRVAIPALGKFLVRFLHVRNPAWIAAALDFFFAFLTSNLLYRIAVNDLIVIKDRLLVIALFLAFLQFPLAWVIPWERPETLPSAFFF